MLGFKMCKQIFLLLLNKEQNYKKYYNDYQIDQQDIGSEIKVNKTFCYKNTFIIILKFVIQCFVNNTIK